MLAGGDDGIMRSQAVVHMDGRLLQAEWRCYDDIDDLRRGLIAIPLCI